MAYRTVSRTKRIQSRSAPGGNARLVRHCIMCEKVCQKCSNAFREAKNKRHHRMCCGTNSERRSTLTFPQQFVGMYNALRLRAGRPEKMTNDFLMQIHDFITNPYKTAHTMDCCKSYRIHPATCSVAGENGRKSRSGTAKGELMDMSKGV